MNIAHRRASTAGFCAIRALSITGLAICAACLCRFAFADLPSDQFQRTATKAIRGDFPGAPAWKLEVYKRGLDLGVTTDRSFLVTQYNRNEGKSGRVDRYGNPCTMRTAASNRLPRKCYVWTEQWGVRQILDCGAKSNDRKADRKGCDSWLDLWFPTAGHARRAGCDGWIPTPGAVIPGA